MAQVKYEKKNNFLFISPTKKMFDVNHIYDEYVNA